MNLLFSRGFATTLISAAIAAACDPQGKDNASELVQGAATAVLPTSCSSETLCDYSGQLLAFPGAEGFGSNTPAGRGADPREFAPLVVAVTNLKALGEGSLPAAVDGCAAYWKARRAGCFITFEVAGTIDLAITRNDPPSACDDRPRTLAERRIDCTTQKLELNTPYLTIAGQTAPPPGVTLRNGAVTLQAHDVLVQHLKVRRGDELCPAIAVVDAEDCMADANCHVIDNCSHDDAFQLLRHPLGEDSPSHQICQGTDADYCGAQGLADHDCVFGICAPKAACIGGLCRIGGRACAEDSDCGSMILFADTEGDSGYFKRCWTSDGCSPGYSTRTTSTTQRVS